MAFHAERIVDWASHLLDVYMTEFDVLSYNDDPSTRKENPLIERSDITIEYLAAILDDAAIDFKIDDDQDLYVTSTEFNLWIKHDPEKQYILLTTYWGFRPEVNELNALRFINRCNANLMPVCQFILNDDIDGCYGSFGIDIRYGLNHRQLLRDMRRFSQTFAMAVRTEDRERLLKPLRGENHGTSLALVLD